MAWECFETLVIRSTSRQDPRPLARSGVLCVLVGGPAVTCIGQSNRVGPSAAQPPSEGSRQLRLPSDLRSDLSRSNRACRLERTDFVDLVGRLAIAAFVLFIALGLLALIRRSWR